MKRLLTLAIAAAATAVGFTPSQAEDIDLFVQPPGEAVGPPNVLIILDNTANWESPFELEMAALQETFESLVNEDGTAKFRLGLMLLTESGGANKGEDGGYIRAAIRDLDEDNAEAYSELVKSFDKNLDKSNGGKASKAMADAYQYFSGLPPLTGNKKSKTDYKGNVFGTTQSKNIYKLPNNALAGFDTSPYTSPIVNGSCAGNYIIYLSNGPVQDNAADIKTATGWLKAAADDAKISGATTPLPISPTGSATNVADEWARFMRQSPRKIVTYTIDVRPAKSKRDKDLAGQYPGWTALLQSMASVSDGKWFDGGKGTGDEIETAFGIIFSEIQAVNSVFASVSLPVSVNPEGNYLNQLYIGMFRPDRKALPRWAGNLKQYKLGIVGDALRTLDADSTQAINSSTGFITECARSFWTPTTADNYWSFRPQGGCINPGGGNYDESNFPDGKVVEKGAQAFVLRSSTARKVMTCSSVFADCSSPGALVDFDTGNVSKTALGDGAMSDATQTTYVDWQIGWDMYDENINGLFGHDGAGDDDHLRASTHGDVIHSRPIAINYGTDVDRKIVVYYGGNDGVLRAVNGNRDTNIGSVTAGAELWSFIPPEFFGSIKRLHDNKVTVSFVGNPAVDAEPKPYGMDGPITSYANNSLFVGMRRGGRALYAFNVTDIAADTPVTPQMLWKIGCPNLDDDTGCKTGFEDIGQTWSGAKVLKTNGYVVNPAAVPLVPKPMLIFGGGYDKCEDADPVTNDCKNDGKGHRIYVVDAATGAKLKEFTTDRGVIGDVFVITDTDGLAKWAYAADLGGNVYRISGDSPNEPMSAADPDDWNMTKIASVGCDDVGDCTDNRKFMFMPDIVEKNGTYYLLLGSGDREKPLDAWPSAYGTENYFFMLMDNPTDDEWLSDEFATCDNNNVLCLDSLQEIDDDNPDLLSDIATKKGWYLPLEPHEQVVTSAITVFGTTTFSTHEPVVPVDGQCTSNLGTARVYNIRFLNAAPRVGEDRSAEVAGGGLPPSPVAGQVTLDDGTTVPFIIGADSDSPLESKLPDSPSTGTQPKNLTYWYIEK